MCSSKEHSCLLNASPVEITFSRGSCPLHFLQDHPRGWLLWRRREAVQASGLQQHYTVTGSYCTCHGYLGHRIWWQGTTGKWKSPLLGYRELSTWRPQSTNRRHLHNLNTLEGKAGWGGGLHHCCVPVAHTASATNSGTGMPFIHLC